MRKLKYPLLYVLIPIVIVVLIFALHTNSNLNQIAQPPDINWSHSLAIDTMTRDNQPFLDFNNGNLEVIYQKKDGLHKTILENINIKSNDVLDTSQTTFTNNDSYKKIGDLVFWEKYSTLNVGVIEGSKLIALPTTWKGIVGYDFVSNGTKKYLLISTKDGLSVYTYDKNQFTLLTTNPDYPNSKWLKGVPSSDGIEVYSVVIQNYIDLTYYRTTYNDQTESWQPTTLLDQSKRLESMFEVSYVQFVPHQDKINIYMIVRIRKVSEIARNIEWISFDRQTGGILSRQKGIEVPIYYGNSSPITDFLSFVDTKDNIDTFIVSTLSKIGRERSNTKVVKLFIENGEVVQHELLSKGSSYSKKPYYLKEDTGDYAVWLDVVNNGYEVKVSSQDSVFKNKTKKLAEGKWALAFGYAFKDFWVSVFSFFKGMLWILPSLLLLIISSIFFSEWLDRKSKIMTFVAIVLYVVIQLFDMDFFYRPQLINYMPNWLTFSGGKYIIPLVIDGLLIIPTWGFMKKVELPSPYSTFFYFSIIQLIIINLLYSPYLVL